jgi:hypothetical protein
MTDPENETTSPAVPAESRGRARGTAVILLFWLTLFFLGSPLAFYDDLYFVGPAISLATGHGFNNPYSRSILLLDDQKEFLVYMPLHGHVLAGWIGLFGYGRSSLAFFVCLASAVGTLGLWWTIFRNAALVYSFALSICVAIFLSATGMRPEALGLAFFCWGLLVFRAKTSWVWFVACTCLFASIITSPNIGLMVPLVFGGILYQAFLLRTITDRAWILKLGLAVISFFLIFLLFLILIHFAPVRFWIMFNKAKEVGSEFSLLNDIRHSGHSARDILRIIFHVFVPTFLLIFGLTGAFIGRETLRLGAGTLGLIFLGAATLFIPGLTSATGMPLQSFYCSVALLFLASRLPRRFQTYGLGGCAVVLILFFFSSGHRLLQVATVPFVRQPNENAAVSAQAEKLSGATVYVDQFALDAVYNYHLPANCVDYHFGLTTRFAARNVRDFPPGSVLVVSRETLLQDGFPQGKPAKNGPRRIPWVGSLFPLEIANPYECEIIQIPPSPSKP